jgi:valine--pyruvate aminotransferase
MDDLTDAFRPERESYRLGGGTPAHIPQVQKIFRDTMESLLADGRRFEQAIGNYEPPQGNIAFIEALVRLLNDTFGWALNAGNVALTHGSQQAFFVLFNMFAGAYPDGTRKKILFPLSPEYIGYCDVGLEDNLFESALPSVEMLDDLFFKYHIDFDSLDIGDHIGAICVSRPTNPTGNVLTDEEISKLAHLAKNRQIPLILDNAYGKPFPDVIFSAVNPYWDEHCIICMSLSKLGLPGTRTGIVIGPEDVIYRIRRINTVISLSPGGMGTAIATDMVRSGSILSMCQHSVQPFYREKMETAVVLARRYFKDVKVAIHRPEGAFFLWLWFKDLPVSCHELYQRLKERGVIVVPGNYFFFGLQADHPHRDQCLRIHYAQEKEVVETAFRMIAEEVEKLTK